MEWKAATSNRTCPTEVIMMSNEQPIDHTIICIPTEHWDVLEETLGLDSQSSMYDTDIKEDINAALDELEQSILPSRIVEMLPKSILDGDLRFPDYNGACTLGEVLNALFGDIQDLLDAIHYPNDPRFGKSLLIDRQVVEGFKALYGRKEESQ
jgi:hypothetical protein